MTGGDRGTDGHSGDRDRISLARRRASLPNRQVAFAGVRNGSSAPDCLRNQEYARSDDNAADCARRVDSNWRSSLNGDRCRDDRHRAQVHDADDQQDRRQVGATGNAVKTEAQTVPPRSRAGGRYRSARR